MGHDLGVLDFLTKLEFGLFRRSHYGSGNGRCEEVCFEKQRVESVENDTQKYSDLFCLGRISGLRPRRSGLPTAHSVRQQRERSDVIQQTSTYMVAGAIGQPTLEESVAQP